MRSIADLGHAPTTPRPTRVVDPSCIEEGYNSRMLTGVKRTPKLVLAGIQVRWYRVGEVQASRYSGNLDASEIWMPRPTNKPGLYRISIDLPGDSKAIYIGEGANISRRLGDYAKIYNEDRQTEKDRSPYSAENAESLG